MPYACRCPEAHVHTTPCSDVQRCHGARHHALAHLDACPKADVELALDAVAAQDGVDGDEARAVYALGASRSRCDASCRCVCHVCVDACFDFAAARRQEAVAGPIIPLFLPTAHCLVRTDDGLVPRPLADVGDLAAESAIEAVAHATSVGVEPPPDATRLRSVAVVLRIEAGAHVFDTLLVDPETTWRALLVDYGELLLLAPPASPDAFDSYLGWLAFVEAYGRRPYTLASPEQKQTALRTVSHWRHAASAHPAHEVYAGRGRRPPQREVNRMLATPEDLVVGRLPRRGATTTSVQLLVRLIHDHGVRLRRQHVDHEIAHAFVAVGRVAERTAREGAPSAAFDAYHELWHEAKRRRGD